MEVSSHIKGHDDRIHHRSYGGVDEDEEILKGSPVIISGSKQSVDVLRRDIIGSFQKFEGPFGPKPCVYADWTASGRAIRQIESFVASDVLPFYGNTHTVTSITGNQSTCYRHESRQVVAQAVNAKISGRAAVDVVIFVGNGTTAAVDKLITSLDLHIPIPENVRDESTVPVVFTSSYEHHSNLLPWRESMADVVTIKYSETTGVCLTDLYEKLRMYQNRRLKIGAFSAASNVTGILTDVDAVSIAMHKAGGVVVFDYATAAPYVKIDMNPVIMGDDAQFVHKDAIFFSGHKFIGGPGSPGVLVVKKTLLLPSTMKPTVPGGGTVFFVTEEHHRYLSNRSEREEGGTPNIVGDIRLGLVMHLKQSIGTSWIENEERSISFHTQQRLSRHPKIILLGRRSTNKTAELHNHIPVFSFLIRAGQRFLHHNFVCALLNDLFGVQTRGGCQCAGPYSQSLLGLIPGDIEMLENALLDKHEVLRPGYSRFSLPFWLTSAEVDYILSSIEFVADNGYLFLPLYRYNPKTGEWAHTTRLTRFPERKWLSNFRLLSNKETDSQLQAPNVSNTDSALCSGDHIKNWGCRDDAELFNIIWTAVSVELEKAKNMFQKKKYGNLIESNVDLATFENIRWFFNSSDMNTTPWGDHPEEKAPIGPVQPQRWQNESFSEHQSLDVSKSEIESAYARKRDGNLPALVGGEQFLEHPMPRYLKFSEEKLSKPLQVQDATAFISGDLSVKRLSEASNIEIVQETLPLKVQPNAVVSDILFAQKGKEDAVSARSEHSNTIESAENKMLCISESCVPVNKGKILSGPGLLFESKADLAAFSGKVFLPPKKIMKLVGQAIRDWQMIQEGDRLLLGLSGGKDSLALLHILLTLQKRSPVKFQIACATVDPQTESFDPSPLIPYVQSLNVPYHYLSEPIVELAKTKMQGDSLCAFCARFKRGLLYSCCRNNGYNKLVLAQHLDDLAESFIMSALHNGQVRTMKANYGIEAGDVSVIRPLVYVREVETRNFSMSMHLPIINENCPACFEKPKERHRVKKLLQQEEAMVPGLFFNLRKAMEPLMDDRIYETMKDINKTILERSVKPNEPSTKSKLTAENGTEAVRKRQKVSDEIGVNAAKTQIDASSEPQCTSDYCAPCYELA